MAAATRPHSRSRWWSIRRPAGRADWIVAHANPGVSTDPTWAAPFAGVVPNIHAISNSARLVPVSRVEFALRTQRRRKPARTRPDYSARHAPSTWHRGTPTRPGDGSSSQDEVVRRPSLGPRLVCHGHRDSDTVPIVLDSRHGPGAALWIARPIATPVANGRGAAARPPGKGGSILVPGRTCASGAGEVSPAAGTGSRMKFTAPGVAEFSGRASGLVGEEFDLAGGAWMARGRESEGIDGASGPRRDTAHRPPAGQATAYA